MVVASSKERGSDRKGSLSLWNSRTSSKVGILSVSREEDLDSPVNCASFSHSGQVIAAGSEDGMVSLYDTSSRNVIAGFPACNDGSIVDIKFGCKDESVWTLSSQGQVLELKLSTSEAVREIDLTKHQTIARDLTTEDEVVIDPTGEFLISTLGKEGVVLKLGLDSGKLAVLRCESNEVMQPESCTSLDWHPSFEQFVIGADSSAIRIYALLCIE